MSKFAHMITVFDGAIDDVAIRLGECQQYSNKITQQALINKGIDVNNDKIKFLELLKVLKKRKNKTVSFYFLKEDSRFYIFSEFFNLEGAFLDAFSFFNDLNNVVMMCERNGTSLYVSLTRLGKVIFQSVVDTTNQGSSWQRDYSNVFHTVNGLPSITDITASLNFMLQESYRKDDQMHKYLGEKALFVDRYII